MTTKENDEAKEIARQMSELIGKPCSMLESDLGGRFSIWISGEGGALLEMIIGFAPIKELHRQFYAFEKAWNMAKVKFEQELKITNNGNRKL